MELKHSGVNYMYFSRWNEGVANVGGEVLDDDLLDALKIMCGQGANDDHART